MLTAILNNIPSPKFIIIEDSIVLRGHDVLLSIVKAHHDIKRHEIHYFCFETDPNCIKHKFLGDKVKVYDYLTDSKGWVNNILNFEDEINTISGIIVIDSLANFIFEYGLINSYKILNKLSSKVVQICTLLHTDCLENKIDTLKYFQHICTLNIKLHIVQNLTRVEYIHKKSMNKLIKKTEDYYFENGILKTKSIEKFDHSKILGPTQVNTTPENLSTFKISLEEQEKISRENITLPYTTKAGGNVIYNLDDDDDWDDEDPDDDLDI